MEDGTILCLGNDIVIIELELCIPSSVFMLKDAKSQELAWIRRDESLRCAGRRLSGMMPTSLG